MRRALVVSWCLAWAGVTVVLLMPAPIAAPSRFDLVVHFGLFGGMAFGAVAFCHHAGWLAALAVVTASGGTALEIAQGWLPYRTFDLTDALANGLGVIAGYATALVMLYVLIRPAAASLRDRRLASAGAPDPAGR